MNDKDWQTIADKYDPDKASLVDSMKPIDDITHSDLVELTRRWALRRLKASVMVTEMASSAGEEPDVIAWTGGSSVLFECKVSRSDFKAELRKPWRYRLGAQRYYVSLPGIIGIDEIGKWGLLEFKNGRFYKRKESDYFHDNRNMAGEIKLLISCLRRIAKNQPDSISVRNYTIPTDRRATLGVLPDEK